MAINYGKGKNDSDYDLAEGAPDHPVMACHILSCNVILCHVMVRVQVHQTILLCHVIFCHVLSCSVMSWCRCGRPFCSTP